jgi:hypothetical protein
MYGLSGKVYSSASVMALICTALALPALDQRSGASALAGQAGQRNRQPGGYDRRPIR